MPKQSTITVAELAPLFIEWAYDKFALSTVKQYESNLRVHILPHLGERHLSSLDKSVVGPWYTFKLPKTTAKRNSWMCFRSMMSFAHEAGLIPQWNVGMKGSSAKASAERPTFTHANFKDVLCFVPESWKPHLLVMLGCGLRTGEMAGLQFGDWDGDTLLVERQWSFGKYGPVKNGEVGRVRPFPFAAVALDKLVADRRPWDKDDSPLLKGRLGGIVHVTSMREKVWAPARHYAKLNGYHLHDLRHQAISAMGRSGADLKTVQAFARIRTPRPPWTTCMTTMTRSARRLGLSKPERSSTCRGGRYALSHDYNSGR